MKLLRALILIFALLLVFVFGLSFGVYTSHMNPDFYRQFALFRDVIPGQPLEIAEPQAEEERVPELSDEVFVLEPVESLSELVEPAVTELTGDRITLTNLKGEQLEVTLLDADSRFVRIRRERDGREFSLGLDNLIEPDRAAIGVWRESKESATRSSDEVDLDELFEMFNE